MVKRKPDPEKYCKHCSKRMYRKRYPPVAGDTKHPGGRLQDLTEFGKTQYCSKSCEHGMGRAVQDGDHRQRLDDLQAQNEYLAKELAHHQREDKSQKENLFYTNMIIERIEGIIPQLPPVKPYKHEKKTKTREIENAVLWGDWHTGKHVDKKEINGFNEYDIDIFKSRLRNMIEGIHRITDLHREDSAVKKLNLLSLGDMLDGDDIYLGHKSRLTNHVIEQIFICVNESAQAISELAKNYEEIRYVGICGNHGRIGRKGENKFLHNYEYLYYRMLERELSAHKNIEFIIPESYFYIHEIQGFKFFLTHGDDIPSWNSIPWYGIIRAVSSWISMLDTQGKRFDYVTMGHFHSSHTSEFQAGKEVFMNGCLCGSDFNSIKRLRKTSTPTQWMLGVHPEHGVTYRYPLKV